jgi:hypothetical protein
MSLPDADALQAYIDCPGDHCADFTVRRAGDDAEQGKDQQGDTKEPEARTH